MMTKCPECGSKDIVPDLILFGDYETRKWPSLLILVHPTKKAEPAMYGLRVAVCGACGHAEMYTKYGPDLLQTHRDGFITQQPT